MEFSVATHIVVDEYMQTDQTQSLARAIQFAAPRTVTVDMTQSSVRVWNPLLFVPKIRFQGAQWDRNNQSSLGISAVSLRVRVCE